MLKFDNKSPPGIFEQIPKIPYPQLSNSGIKAIVMSDINYSAIHIIIKQIKKIEDEYKVCGDMSLSDELDKITDFLDLLKNRWDLKIEALSKLQRKYILDSEELKGKEEKQCWQQVSILIESLAKFNSYIDYISIIDVVLKQIVTELQDLEKQQLKSN